MQHGKPGPLDQVRDDSSAVEAPFGIVECWNAGRMGLEEWELFQEM